jgi:hypothetical protein
LSARDPVLTLLVGCCRPEEGESMRATEESPGIAASADRGIRRSDSSPPRTIPDGGSMPDNRR